MNQRLQHVSANALIMGLRGRRAVNRTRLRLHSMRTDHVIRWSHDPTAGNQGPEITRHHTYAVYGTLPKVTAFTNFTDHPTTSHILNHPLPNRTLR